MNMNKETLLTVFLAVLVLVSAIQAVQLISLGSALSSGSTTVARPPPAQASSGGATLPSASSLDDLSGMVGGC